MMAKRFVLLALVFGALILTAALRATAADPEKGKAAFDKCAACHVLDQTPSDGPTLRGIFGRKAGALDDYRYSAAMKRSGIVWDAATLDAYIADPQGYIKGNRMAFAGITDKSERDDLIAYLEQATKPRD
jgi:cytochrome c